MASPQRPVLALAVTTPKWARIYVDESSLGQVKSWPAVVSRRREQSPQKGWVTEEMTPISPAQSMKRQRWATSPG